jgi:hypothetical protein
MLNQRVISVEVKGNEFVKKIQIVLKDLPTPFPSFKKEIGIAPNLEKVFRAAKDKENFYNILDKFENYLKKAYDDDSVEQKTIDQCVSWIKALEELFRSINDENRALEIKHRFEEIKIAINNDVLLKRFRGRELKDKLFSKKEKAKVEEK